MGTTLGEPNWERPTQNYALDLPWLPMGKFESSLFSTVVGHKLRKKAHFNINLNKRSLGWQVCYCFCKHTTTLVNGTSHGQEEIIWGSLHLIPYRAFMDLMAFVLWICISITTGENGPAQLGTWGPVSTVPSCHASFLSLGAQVENEGLHPMICECPQRGGGCGWWNCHHSYKCRLLKSPSWSVSKYVTSVTSLHTSR